jgi:hypothetical protein
MSLTPKTLTCAKRLVDAWQKATRKIREAAKRFRDRHGPDALSEADAMLQEAIRQRDAEALSIWRALIRALPRTQP